uniref:Predicted protein n=1 Tax=Hordeum vulgare subsp. vulgare TaxID=112509 RepID=F2DJ98_HORVV|nr:predicted protein [Hordeum vulgare subsp. vulgare]
MIHLCGRKRRLRPRARIVGGGTPGAAYGAKVDVVVDVTGVEEDVPDAADEVGGQR